VRQQIGLVTALTVVGVLVACGAAAALNDRLLSAPSNSALGTAIFVSLDEQPGAGTGAGGLSPSPTAVPNDPAASQSGDEESASSSPSRTADEPGTGASPTAPPTSGPVVVVTNATDPIYTPSTKPTTKPTAKPTTKPTAKPTAKPTTKPTTKPTVRPTPSPTPRNTHTSARPSPSPSDTGHGGSGPRDD